MQFMTSRLLHIEVQERKNDQLLLLAGATTHFPELTPPEDIQGRVSESQCLSWTSFDMI